MFTATDFQFAILTPGIFLSVINWTSIFIYFLFTVEITVSLLMVFLILMQRPKSEGLGAAFGGGMTEGLFGAQTTNVLQKATRWLAGIFFLVALILSMLYSKSHSGKGSVIQQQLANAPAPKEQKADETPLVPVTGGTSAAAISGTGAAPSTNATTGETPSPDLTVPPLQLGPAIPTGTGASSDEIAPPKLQLQTGSAAPAGTDIFKTGGATSGTGQK